MPEFQESGLREDVIQGCEEVLRYRFRDRRLLERCLTHASVARTRLDSNERLEFLGDAILGVVVCEMLFHRFPDFPEGDLTKIKSALVSRNTCAQMAEELGLDDFLQMGKGLRLHDRLPLSIHAAIYEALVAGIYLDGGFEAAREFVERTIGPELERTIERNHTRNFKSMLQQLAQKDFGETPVYRVLDEKGPDHSKCFNVSAVIGQRAYTAAWGPSKKEAEQRAAHNALNEIAGKELPVDAE
jgi:ribonuclease-3